MVFSPGLNLSVGPLKKRDVFTENLKAKTHSFSNYENLQQTTWLDKQLWLDPEE